MNAGSKLRAATTKGTLEVVNTMIVSGFTAFTSTYKGNLELEILPPNNIMVRIIN